MIYYLKKYQNLELSEPNIISSIKYQNLDFFGTKQKYQKMISNFTLKNMKKKYSLGIKKVPKFTFLNLLSLDQLKWKEAKKNCSGNFNDQKYLNIIFPDQEKPEFLVCQPIFSYATYFEASQG